MTLNRYSLFERELKLIKIKRTVAKITRQSDVAACNIAPVLISYR